MFCALKTLLQCFKNIKLGGCFAPPVISLGGKTTPLFYILESSVITLLLHKTCLHSFKLHCLYIKQGGWCLSSQSLKKVPVIFGFSMINRELWPVCGYDVKQGRNLLVNTKTECNRNSTCFEQVAHQLQYILLAKEYLVWLENLHSIMF